MHRLLTTLTVSVKVTLKVFLTQLLLILSFTSLLWYVWYLGLFLILIVIFLWVKPRKLAVIFFAASILALPFSFKKISSRMDYYGTLIRTEGASALTTPERLSIYLGNISMALVGFVILAPEVSIETLFMMDPRGKDRHFNSDFAMDSDHISRLINAYTEKVKKGQAPLVSDRIPLRWGKSANGYSMKDYRVALALAGGGLFLEYKKNENGYSIKSRITVGCGYSDGPILTIFDNGWTRLYIDEVIFFALEELGWLHPYYAHYNWNIEV